MKEIARVIILVAALVPALVLGPVISVQAQAGPDVLTREEFDLWPEWPEYTVFNPFPYKGRNCTWYAHGRMMQLGYSKYTLDTMRFHAGMWAGSAGRGARVSDTPQVACIAFWANYAYFGSALGHVGVVEKIYEDGSILVSDSSSSGRPYNTFKTSKGDGRWPTSFIIVPEAPERSSLFSPGEKVRTTASSLNFRLEGIDQAVLQLPRHTPALILEHPANGIHASYPGNIVSYNHWWYAQVSVEGLAGKGWLAETFIESVAPPDPAPPPAPAPPPDPAPEPDPVPNPDPEPVPVPAPNPDPEAGDGREGDRDEDRDEDRGEDQDGEEDDGRDSETEEEPASLPGDINFDGQVDIRDVALAMRQATGSAELEGAQLAAADVNKDGLVDVRDVVLIKRFVLKLIDTL